LLAFLSFSSPFSAGAVLLPLTPENNYTPEVMICGGSTVSDTAVPSTVSPQTPASTQCIRMVLNTAGIAAGWKVESMPQARVMPELIQLPDMSIVIVNGAQTGVAGYGNVSLFFEPSESCDAESVTVYGRSR
jgi:hypothetical protein